MILFPYIQSCPCRGLDWSWEYLCCRRVSNAELYGSRQGVRVVASNTVEDHWDEVDGIFLFHLSRETLCEYRTVIFVIFFICTYVHSILPNVVTMVQTIWWSY
jgi:hypothetical protein